jgi:3-hydroxybutyryl-CoA dehydratase
MPIDEFNLGQCSELTRTLTESDVMAFAQLTGDFNPVHVDAALAAASPFGDRIVHGMLTASLLSTLIAMQLPGPGAIYLSQTLSFLRPVKIGTTLVARVEITAIDAVKGRLTLSTTIRNERGKNVVSGEAVVQLPS